MRVRELACWLAVLGACTHIPGSGPRSLEMMERQGWGGYIVVNTRPSGWVAGELLAVDPKYVYVLRGPVRPTTLVAIGRATVSSAKLYRYEPEGGFGTWGIFGALSSLSHGFLLILSVPVWVLSAGVSSDFERTHVVMEYPDTDWPEFAKWARFPQGLPPNVPAQSLIPSQHGASPSKSVPAASP